MVAAGRHTSPAYSALFVLLLAPLLSQETISVNYVLVPFVPLDAKGRPLRDVRERDVRLFVDGAPVAFDLFTRTADAPVSYTILLDVSGSMALAGKMAGARTAINALLATRQPGDDFSLWTFAEGEVEEAVPFTQDVRPIMNAVLRAEPYGKTALHDALAKMPDKSILGRNGSRAIILLTDALDNASTITRAQLTNILGAVDVPIYPLGLRPKAVKTAAPPSPDSLTDVEMLQEVGRGSGGGAVISHDLGELERGIERIQRDLRSQYLIGFAPSGRGAVRFRRITLKIAGRDRSARLRAGYQGTAPTKTKAREKS